MDYEHDDRRAADVPGASGAEGSGLPAGREPRRRGLAVLPVAGGPRLRPARRVWPGPVRADRERSGGRSVRRDVLDGRHASARIRRRGSRSGIPAAAGAGPRVRVPGGAGRHRRSAVRHAGTGRAARGAPSRPWSRRLANRPTSCVRSRGSNWNRRRGPSPSTKWSRSLSFTVEGESRCRGTRQRVRRRQRRPGPSRPISNLKPIFRRAAPLPLQKRSQRRR